MRRSLFWTFLLGCLVLGAGLEAQEPHVLRVGHADASGGVLELEGVSGTSSGAVECLVELDVPATAGGVHAWRFGLAHDPNILALVGATLAGTAGDVPGFARVDILDEGLVSSVELEADPANVLPPGSRNVVLQAAYEGIFPAKDTTVQTRLRLVDGLSGPGGPVAVELDVEDGAGTATVSPQREDLIVLLSGFEYSDLFDLTLQVEGLETSPAGGDGGPGEDRGPVTDPAVVTALVKPGSSPVYAVKAMLDSRLPDGAPEGVQGWSLSIAQDPAVLEIVDVTTAGTDAGLLLVDGFERHEVVDNDSGRGLVSAVVLSFTQPVSLPPQGRAALLGASYRLLGDTSAEGSSVETEISFADSLRGEGQPVKNVVTVEGLSHRPRVRRGLRLDLTVGFPPREPFVRADANNDGRVDVADAVWIAAELYFRGPPAVCFYAADANGDGRKDVSDVAFLVAYQFLGGSAPPAPFPGCGVLPEQDARRCPLGSTACLQP